MSLVYLGLGTNLGARTLNLNKAVGLLSMEVGKVLAVSSYYHSSPWGFESENEFLNAVALVETDLTPFEVLTGTQQIERDMGRTVKSSGHYADRLIDIDILLFDNLIIDQPTLVIPHPLLSKRDFVLKPLNELAPGLIHPVLGKTIEALNRELNGC